MPSVAKVVQLRDVSVPRRLRPLLDVFPGLGHLSHRLAARTLEEYGRDAAHYLRFCHNDAATVCDPESLRRWRDTMVTDTPLSPRTINRRLNTIRTLAQACAACGAWTTVEAAHFHLVEKVKISAFQHRLKRNIRTLLTPEQVRALCRSPDPTTPRGVRNRAFLFVLATSGCRLGEAVSLRVEDLMPLDQGGVLHLWGKNQEHKRRAPLTVEAWDWVQRWIRLRDQVVRSPWVFTACDHDPYRLLAHPMAGGTGWLVVRTYAQELGLEISPHHLRRFVATQVAARSGIRAAQLILGHRLQQTTLTHYVIDELDPTITEGLF